MPQVNEGGRPVILYTGVVKRPGVPPVKQVHSLDVSRLCVETQLAAVAADPGELRAGSGGACTALWPLYGSPCTDVS
jgi:hypothetical protein